MHNYLEHMKDVLSVEGYIQSLKTVANWCNGNIMAISKQRLKSMSNDPEHLADKDEEIQRERSHELGFKTGVTLVERGSIFASIRRSCIDAAEDLASGRQMAEFDYPRNFKDYIESRITGFRRQLPTPENIKLEMANTIGITEEEAKNFLIKSYGEQAAMLEAEKDDLIAEDGTYDEGMDIEQAISKLPCMTQHRLRTKVIDGLMYEVDRLQATRTKYPNFEDLRTKRDLLLRDALMVEDELKVFGKAYDKDITEELGDQFMLTWPTKGHQSRMDLTRKQLKEVAEAKARLEIEMKKAA